MGLMFIIFGVIVLGASLLEFRQALVEEDEEVQFVLSRSSLGGGLCGLLFVVAGLIILYMG